MPLKTSICVSGEGDDLLARVATLHNFRPSPQSINQSIKLTDSSLALTSHHHTSHLSTNTNNTNTVDYQSTAHNHHHHHHQSTASHILYYHATRQEETTTATSRHCDTGYIYRWQRWWSKLRRRR